MTDDCDVSASDPQTRYISSIDDTRSKSTKCHTYDIKLSNTRTMFSCRLICASPVHCDAQLATNSRQSTAAMAHTLSVHKLHMNCKTTSEIQFWANY